jgi:aromatic ring-opening dioxygenase catalytic subunit (LigB family)
MKQIMGIGASHVPYLTGNTAMGDPGQVVEILEAFQQTKEEIEQFQPDLVILISADHIDKFFMDNVPAFCVGVAPQFDGPSDRGSGLPHRVFPGHETFAEQFITFAYENGFDLSYTRHWSLDHGYMVPLHLLTEFKFPVVPMFVNAAMPPSPTSRRSLDLGKLIRSYVEAQDYVQKIVIIGAGGLSHSVGAGDMGRIDEAFDRRFLGYLEEGDEQALASLSYKDMLQAGNSTPEVLAWLAAAGAFLPAKAATRCYIPIRGFATGCAISRWEIDQL